MDLDLIIGKQVDAYVFYVDLLGTKSRIRKASEDPAFAKLRDVAWSQSWFVSSLAREALQTPAVLVEQLSDCAFAYSEDLSALSLLSMRVLFRLTNDSTGYNLIPARGAIAQGLTDLVSDVDDLNVITNFRYSSAVGQGMVDAFEIEQAGAKGMRLFIAESIVNHLPNWVKRRPAAPRCRKKAPAFSELNWMAFEDDHGVPILETQDNSYGNVRGALQKIAKDWSASRNKEMVKVGLSLSDLIEWA